GINMEGYAYEYVNREEEGNEPREREARRVRGKNAYGYDLPDGKYAVMLETIFNVRIDKFTEAVENNEIAKWAEETFFVLTVRDMFFDIVKEAVGENENYVFEGYASEDKEVTGKAHKIINATLGVSISSVVNAIREDKVAEFFEETYGEVEIGDVAEIFMNTEEDVEGNWYNKDTEKVYAPIVNDTFKVDVAHVISYIKNEEKLKATDLVRRILGDYYDGTFYDYIGVTSAVRKYLDEKTFFSKKLSGIKVYDFVDRMMRKGNVDYLFNDAFEGIEAGDLITLFTKAVSEGEDGEWNNEKGNLPAILADLIDVSVSSVYGYIKNEDKLNVQDLVKKIIAENFDRKIADYVAVNDKVRDYIEEKGFFNKSVNDETLPEFVEGILSDERLDYIFGDLMSKVEIGDVIELVTDKIDENDEGEWNNEKGNLPMILTDTIDVSVGQVYGYIKNEEKLNAAEIVKKAVADTYEGTFRDYIGVNDSVKNYLDERSFFVNSINDEKLSVFVEKVIDEKRMDYLFGELFADVEAGDIVNLFANGTVKDGDVWKNGDEAVKMILGDLYGISVGEVYGYVNDFKDENKDAKQTVYGISEDIFGDKSVYNYLDDFGFMPENVGLEKLSSLYITETLGVMLGVITDEADLHSEIELPFVETLDNLRIDYILNHLNIHIGEFVTGKEKPEEGWSDNAFVNFVYNVKVNEVVMVIGAIIMYKKVLETIGEDKLGKYFGELYNKAGDKFDSHVELDGEDYVVRSEDGGNGKFADLVETLMNIVINDLYHSITGEEGKTFMGFVEEKFYPLTMGDFLYDLVSEPISKAFNTEFNGYEAEGNAVNGRLSAILNATFGVSIDDIVTAAKSSEKNFGEYLVEDVYGAIMTGDLATLAVDIRYDEENEVWTKDGEEIKHFFNDLSLVTVNDIYGYIRNEDGKNAREIAKTVVGDIFADNTFNYYLGADQIEAEGARKVFDSNIFQKTLGVREVAEIAAELIDIKSGKDAMNAVKDIFGAIAVGDFYDLAHRVKVDVNGHWYSVDSGKNVIHILDDIFKINVAKVIEFIENENGYDAKRIVEEVLTYVFEDHDVAYYTDEITNSSVRKVLDKNAFKNSIANIVISEYVTSILEADGTNELLLAIRSPFNSLMMGDIVDLIKSVELRDTENWYEKDNDKKLPLIASVFMNVTVQDINDYINAFKGDKQEAVNKLLGGIFKEHTVGEFLDDIENESARKYLDKEFFARSIDNIAIAAYVADIMAADGASEKFDVIRAPFETVRLGDIVDLIKSVELRDTENWYTKANDKKLPLIASVFMNVEIGDIFDYVDAFKGDKQEAVNTLLSGIFGTHTVGDFLEDIPEGKFKTYINKEFFTKSVNAIEIAAYVASIMAAESTNARLLAIRAPFNTVSIGNIVDLIK
ncbi:MAG: hypothetical protein IJ706_02205, partial [Clostridia bacterium]|nr:hypothetical protein [Clostridia bacterium]